MRDAEAQRIAEDEAAAASAAENYGYSESCTCSAPARSEDSRLGEPVYRD